jgi:hypothetical protein
MTTIVTTTRHGDQSIRCALQYEYDLLNLTIAYDLRIADNLRYKTLIIFFWTSSDFILLVSDFSKGVKAIIF